jgi:flavin-dependent dehydrogenase
MLITYDAFERAGRSVMGAVEMTIDHHPTLARTLAPASTLPETECSVAPVDTLRPSQPWVSTACVGDTAAMIPPLVGDGMAMALRSAELCAPLADEYLRGAISIEDWRVQYEFQWHAEFNARLRNSRLLQSALGTRWLANAVIQAGRLLPPVTQKVVRATRGRV